MKIITFATLKGGTGKTMSVFNTAGILAEQNKKVLLIDIDPQANLTNNVGINIKENNYLTIKNVFENPKIDINQVIYKTPIQALPSLDIIPSTIFLTATELKIVSVAGRELILKNFFKKNQEILAQYDYIIFDTNPSMSIINQNAFVLSDGIILVSDTDLNSWNGAELFIMLWSDILEQLDLSNNIKGLLINKYETTTKISNDFVEFCKDNEEIKEILFKTIIPKNVKLPETIVENKPVNLYNRNNKGYFAYKDFARELMARVQTW